MNSANVHSSPVLRVALGVTLLLAAACASLQGESGSARRADDAALTAAPWPADAAWIAVAAGNVTGAPDLDAALAVQPGAPHRYVFRAEEAGDRRLTMAYNPGRGVVAGRAAAEALGVRFRRDARGTTLVIRDVRRITTGDDATITLRVTAPGGGKAYSVPVVIDPDFDGPLLVAPSVAETLQLARFEIPGTVDVQVALGRPFFARRARLRAAIPELGVEALVEAAVPR